jgi:hypothetical protein
MINRALNTILVAVVFYSLATSLANFLLIEAAKYIVFGRF